MGLPLLSEILINSSVKLVFIEKEGRFLYDSGHCALIMYAVVAQLVEHAHGGSRDAAHPFGNYG